MKITFILPGRGRSGGNRVTVIAANGLIERGHQVRLLVRKHRMFSRRNLRAAWLGIRYPGRNDWLQLFKGGVEPFSDLAKFSFESNEIVIAVGLWSCKEVRRLKSTDIKKVHYVHGWIPDDNELMTACWSENVPKIVVASYLEKAVSKITGQQVLAVIPNGIDTNQYYPSVPDSKRDGVGTIFEHDRRKDPVVVLSVLNKLRKYYPGIPQRIIGSGRRPREIPSDIYLRLPSIEKARYIYSRSLVWILASRSEGFPAPILEAMACGCAVVATDCGGPKDIIKDGENGFLTEVGNVDGIVDKVKLLLNNEQLRRRIVKNAGETVKNFNWGSSIDKLETALQTIDSM